MKGNPWRFSGASRWYELGGPALKAKPQEKGRGTPGEPLVAAPLVDPIPIHLNPAPPLNAEDDAASGSCGERFFGVAHILWRATLLATVLPIIRRAAGWIVR